MLGQLPSQMYLFKILIFIDIYTDFICYWEVDQKVYEQGQSKILFWILQNIPNYSSVSNHQ